MLPTFHSEKLKKLYHFIKRVVFMTTFLLIKSLVRLKMKHEQQQNFVRFFLYGRFHFVPY